MISGFLVLISAFLTIATGVYVLAKGDWKPFGLKFAAVALSTSASFVMFMLAYQRNQMFGCEQDTVICLSRDTCIIVRNISIVLFHIAAGRDAIRYRHRDRRHVKKAKTRERKAA